MPFIDRGDLRYYAFDVFAGSPVRQAVFTRRGGVSPSPWNSLNVGGTNGDERARVVENRDLMFEAFGQPVESLFDVWQVHGTEVVATDRPRPLDEAHKQADIIMTDRPGITLFMRFGDCVPILLYDPVRQAAALAHAGWQGTVSKVAAVAVKAMHDEYGSNPADLLAGIGPSVCVDHYEVGSNVILAAQKAFGEEAAGMLIHRNGSIHFDLWEANRHTLKEAGVRHIQVSGVCTVANLQDWFSHRGEHGKTGRFGAVMVLEDRMGGS